VRERSTHNGTNIIFSLFNCITKRRKFRIDDRAWLLLMSSCNVSVLSCLAGVVFGVIGFMINLVCCYPPTWDSELAVSFFISLIALACVTVVFALCARCHLDWMFLEICLVYITIFMLVWSAAFFCVLMKSSLKAFLSSEIK